MAFLKIEMARSLLKALFFCICNNARVLDWFKVKEMKSLLKEKPINKQGALSSWSNISMQE